MGPAFAGHVYAHLPWKVTVLLGWHFSVAPMPCRLALLQATAHLSSNQTLSLVPGFILLFSDPAAFHISGAQPWGLAGQLHGAEPVCRLDPVQAWAPHHPDPTIAPCPQIKPCAISALHAPSSK